MTPRARGAVAAAGVIGVAALLALRVCDLMFACGCTWLWAGAAGHCNAFVEKARMHCPWCVHPALWYGFFGAAALAGAAIAFAGDARGRGGPAPAAPRAGVIGRPARPPVKPRTPGADLFMRVLAGVGTFLALALLAGWITALVTGYPRFLPLS